MSHMPSGLVARTLHLLIIFVAFSLMIGGKRGLNWSLGLIFSPLLHFAERRIRMVVFILTAIVVMYFLGIDLLHRA